MVSKSILSGIIVIVLFVVAVAFMLLPIPQHMEEVAVIKEGQILNLADLSQNMILPNGAELKNFEISILSGVEIISAEYISSEAYPPLKLTWLDSGNNVGYSSHTILNKPSYYFYGGGSGVIKIWPHHGAKEVKVEIWKG